ncbi:hypothetical protein QE152_g26539 [Popillia japonica]|uniref:Uncharacterized protein n=1 Tax=Popillia japonica TaxID=7064 RepID=A0AAW1JYI2_POPJA
MQNIIFNEICGYCLNLDSSLGVSGDEVDTGRSCKREKARRHMGSHIRRGISEISSDFDITVQVGKQISVIAVADYFGLD